MPKVSVIMPLCEQSKSLPQVINNVLNQTWRDLELLVVQHKSSTKIEQCFAQIKDSRVKLISQEEQGFAFACNSGIKHAQGEYITFVDADDCWESTKLAKQVAVLDRQPEVGLVYSWLTLLDAESNLTARVQKNCAQGNVWEKLIEHNIVECASVAMVRRTCFEQVGLFAQNLQALSDWDMWLRIAACYRFAVIQEPLVHHQLNNVQHNHSQILQEHCTVIEKAFQSAPFELLPLRNCSYGHLHLALAWNCLHNGQPDCQQADYFRRQALQHYPHLYLSAQHLRLHGAIFWMRWFGSQSYQKLLSLINSLQRRFAIAQLINT